MEGKKRKILIVLAVFCMGILGFFIIENKNLQENNSNEKGGLEATVINVNKEYVSVQDKDHVIYTFKNENLSPKIGETILLEYLGILDKNKSLQENNVMKISPVVTTSNGIPEEWNDEGIFKDYYDLAYKKMKTMSLSDKIGQLLLVRYPDDSAIEALKKYNFGGFVFFAKDFKEKSKQEVIRMINTLQTSSAIPLLTAVDEEGGSIIRVSSNSNLADHPFKSSKELYQLGGFNRISSDTIEKSKVLYDLGLNLNLAPVVDVTTDESAYMYPRSFGADTTLTSTYAKTVIEASKNTKVSYTLKHFPGYGNNADTHQSAVSDTRSLEDILNFDIPPFESGIKGGAEAVLVSHNIVSGIDANHPSSLSASVHNILRNRLNFTGIIMTDDLNMGATSSIDQKYVEALLAGNDLLIVTDYETAMSQIKKALQDGDISEEMIDKLAFRNLAWKYYKGLLIEKEK